MNSTHAQRQQRYAEILQRLPPGVWPIRHHGDHRRISTEAAIHWHELPADLQQLPPLGWARERLVMSAADVVGVLVAHSVTASGRHVRHWWIRRSDPTAPAYTGTERSCPRESAWLASIRPGQESEPAWLHLRPEAQSLPHDITER